VFYQANKGNDKHALNFGDWVESRVGKFWSWHWVISCIGANV